MNLSEGLNKIEGKNENNYADCMILKKCIHGTVWATYQWDKKFKQTLQESHFTINSINPCIISWRNEKGSITLVIYIYNILLVGNRDAIKDAIKDIKQKYDISQEAPLKDYLG